MKGLPWEPDIDWSIADFTLGLPSDDQIKSLALAVDETKAPLLDRQVSTQETRAREIGFFGLRHVCRVLRRPGNFDVMRRGTGRTSLTTSHGVPVGVVTRTPVKGRVWPELILRVAEKPRPDLALVLVVWGGEEKGGVIGGWVWEEELRQQGRIDRFRDVDNLVLPKTALRDIYTLATTEPRGT